MKVVIDVPESLYKGITEDTYGVHKGRLFDMICNGIPLPETRGRLIDADALVRKAYEEAQGMANDNFGVEVEWLVDKSPTIIEVDK